MVGLLLKPASEYGFVGFLQLSEECSEMEELGGSLFEETHTHTCCSLAFLLLGWQGWQGFVICLQVILSLTQMDGTSPECLRARLSILAIASHT